MQRAVDREVCRSCGSVDITGTIQAMRRAKSQANRAGREPFIRKAFSGECGRLTWWEAMGTVVAVYIGYFVLLGAVLTALDLAPLFFHSNLNEAILGLPISLVAVWVGGGATTRRMRNLGANLWIGWPAIVGSVAAGVLILAHAEDIAPSRGWALLALASAAVLCLGPFIWLGAFPRRRSWGKG